MDYISQGEENEAVLKWSGGGGRWKQRESSAFPSVTRSWNQVTFQVDLSVSQ